MKIEIKVPSVGESVKEAILAEWYKKDGEQVAKGEPLFVLETDKVTLEVESEADGVLKIQVREGETVEIGAVLGYLDADAAATTKAPVKEAASEPEKPVEPAKPEKKADPELTESKEEPEVAAEKIAPQPSLDGLAPSVRRLVAQKNVPIEAVTPTGPGGRVTKGDVLTYLEKKAEEPAPVAKVEVQAEEPVERKPMSPIRRTIAERLLAAKNQTAMLTTFNEIDMSQAMEMRSRYKEAFQKRHEVGLGFMSFFVKTSIQALKEIPAINASIEERDIVYHNYYHVGIAVGSPRGLVVPVIKHADQLNFAGVEQSIVNFVGKIKENKLELSDMEGGTFTITNGGVYGSLMSTPILNTPQSAILGMHKIEKRPIVVNDEIVIRPMMYVALSYDHRIVDGKEAVTFLKRIKECVENPERILMEV